MQQQLCLGVAAVTVPALVPSVQNISTSTPCDTPKPLAGTKVSWSDFVASMLCDFLVAAVITSLIVFSFSFLLSFGLLLVCCCREYNIGVERIVRCGMTLAAVEGP